MTLRSVILAGSAALALSCAGFAAPSLAQSASPASPDTATNPDTQVSANADTSKPKKVAKHHPYRHHTRVGWHHARFRSMASERAETRRLNNEQLAQARAASQGQYGTMQPPPSPGVLPAVPDNTERVIEQGIKNNTPQAPNAPSVPHPQQPY